MLRLHFIQEIPRAGADIAIRFALFIHAAGEPAFQCWEQFYYFNARLPGKSAEIDLAQALIVMHRQAQRFPDDLRRLRRARQDRMRR